jgi:hypothetical protein
MNEHSADPQLPRDSARMLPARTPENIQDVCFRVEASRLSECANGATHGLIGHADEAEGHIMHGGGFVGGLVDLCGERLEGKEGGLVV